MGGVVLPNVSYCEDNNEVHYNPLVDPYNGKAYVDLGLPSGTKWAKMNVGATSETDYGLYFAWGEIQGYTAEQVPSEKAFNWDNYKWTEDRGNTFTKYNSTDGKTVLDLEDDAAHVNWGGDWHMPTKEQCEELFNTKYVTNTWTTVNGINGRLFTSVSNGNTLFIPAAGYCEDGGVYAVGSRGDVWASALNSGRVESAWGFYFNSGGAGVYGYIRFNGQSVRGVVG